MADISFLVLHERHIYVHCKRPERGEVETAHFATAVNKADAQLIATALNKYTAKTDNYMEKLNNNGIYLKTALHNL